MNYNIAEYEKSFGTAEQLLPSSFPEFCFSGRSNVGKSSLINKIVNRKSLARVSSSPGKTVTINFYKIDTIRLVDLPGYGYAKVPFGERTRWSDLMESYFRTGRNIKIVFQLIDMRHPPTDFDISMLDFLYQMKIPYCVVLTKSDKLNKTEFNLRMDSIKDELGIYGENIKIIPTCATNGLGIDKIKEILEGN
ncbi:MAG: YihA family ribosome biogenesis GTP-binding protein [Ruminococcaceae bacterium]|nr:YihA family ribosome biogenesis GTP-binding protein [Oscillospiraceae bacterium]